MKNSHFLCLLLFAFLFSSMVVRAQDLNAQLPVVYGATTTVGSLAGGTVIQYSGYLFSSVDPGNNQVFFCDYQIPCDTVTFETTPTLVTCVTRAYYEYTQCDVWIEVDGEQTASAPSFSYVSWMTPILAYIYSPAITPSGLGLFNLYPLTTDSTQISTNVGQEGTAMVLGNDGGDLEIDPINAYAYQDFQFDTGDNVNLVPGWYNLTIFVNPLGNSLATATNWFYSPSGQPAQVSVLPNISSLSITQGSSQGALITVVGSGFPNDLTQITAKLGTQTVQVLSTSFDQLSVRFPPSNGEVGPFKTHAGLKVYEWENSEQINTIQSLRAAFIENTTATIALASKSYNLGTSEPLPNSGFNNYIRRAAGWFQSPVNGSISFYVSGDDQVALYFNPIAEDSTPPANPIVYVSSATPFRNYYQNTSEQISQPIESLEAGSNYWIEIWHLQSSGSDHFSVGFSFDQGIASATRLTNLATIFDIQVNSTQYYDQLNVIASLAANDKANNASWALTYITQDSNGNNITVQTNSVGWNASDSDVASIFTVALGVSVDVTHVITTGGSPAINFSTADQVVWNITLLGRKTQDYKTITSSLVTPPILIQTVFASPQLSGSFTINLYGANVVINVCDDYWTVQPKITAIPSITDPVVGSETGSCGETGRTWRFELDGAQPRNVPTPQLVSTAISGGATPATVTITTIQNGSLTEQLWSTIPSYLLQANSDLLEFSLEAVGIRALATGSVGYTYLNDSSVPTISAVSRNGLTLTVTLSNVQNPSFDATDIDYFAYSGTPVTTWNVAASGTSNQYTLTATLAANTDNSPVIVAGNSIPEISIAGIGFALKSSTLTLADIGELPTASAVSPSTGSTWGFTSINITGHYFGYSLSNSLGTTVTVGGAPCTITSLSNIQISCVTSPQASGSSVVITVNGETNTYSNLFTYTTSGVPSYTSSSPVSANPSLQSTLQISGSFGSSPVASNFQVYLDALDSNSSVSQYGAYECYATSVNSTTLECLLAGGIASPTLYNVRVIVNSIGAAIPSPSYPTFQFLVSVSGISPSSGSYGGGTLITITGTNFPADITENQVTIGDDLILCTMISATETTLTCLTGAANSDYATDVNQPVYVLSRIQDEATFSPSTACEFAYSNSRTPIVNAVNTTSGVAGDTILLTGTNLEADPSQIVNVTVGGVVANVINSSLSSTSVSFKVPGDLAVGGNYTIQVLVGNKGYATFAATSLSVFSITGRQILEINPQSLSQAGGILTISGGGFSASDTVKVNGAHVAIISYTLDTLQILVPSTTSTSLSVVVSYSGGALAAPSSISITTSSASTAIISGVVVSGTSGLTVSDSSAFTLDFTGTNLALEAPTVILTDNSNSSSVYTSTLSSTPGATSFSAPFTNVVVGNYSLIVNYPDYGYAKITASSSVITVIWVTPSASPSTVISGIAGGAQVTITGNGFPSLSQSYYIDFEACGVQGEIVSTSASSIVVRAPPFITQLSLLNYNLAVVDEIFGTPISDNNPSEASYIFDGIFETYYSSSEPTCYIGVDFGANSVGILSKISYFPKVDSDTNLYYGTLLQGSNDNVTWSPIQVTTTDSSGNSVTSNFAIDYNIHNGYNDIVFSSNQQQQPSYRYYRFLGNGTASQCNFAEIQFWGIIGSSKTPSSLASNTCDGVLKINGQSQTFSGLVNYQSAVTPTATDVEPPYASADGGENITITGTGFPSGQTSAASVTIDGTICDVLSVTSTTVVCTTRQAPPRNLRPQSLDSSIKVWFSSSSAAGYAAGWQSLYFLVTERWTDTNTWGGLPPPSTGDSVYVPSGLSLLVDTSANVYAVVIEGGALVFSDEGDFTFDANYVFVMQGIFRAGTPDRPYVHQLTITMHGTKYDSQLPTYGNKNIAVRYGYLDLNGIPRTPTWTFLAQTVLSGANSITLLTTVDWQPGEEIVLASSTFEHGNSETAFIQTGTNTTASVNGTELQVTVLTLNKSLLYNHYSNVLPFTKSDGTIETITMRTEVGLLTRNIIFQGDSNSETSQYGAHIMIYSPGDESSVGRISYIRVRYAGQAYFLGRYPIHFHLIGTVALSFVRGNAIHNTYNRATTIHGVHYLTVEDNVVYYCMGHNIFIEDGIETNNLVQNNLVISTLESYSLLETDQTPASFWITNPNNNYIGNHAAGSSWYGFWLDFQPNPTGPSYTPDICPPGTRLGEFSNNVAHSNGRYGLRIFHLHTPTVDPCSSWGDTNPSVPATYKNFTGWKNMRAGIIGETLGELTFANIFTADNLQSGVELSVGGEHGMLKLVVTNVLAVGLTENAADDGVNQNDSTIYGYYWDRPARGIVTTRNDGMLVSNVRFYNWPPGTVAFMDCSHCEFDPSTDSGARTAFIEQVYYSPSFHGIKIQYNIPVRGIFRDMDGTLTGQVGWATAYFPHNDVPECTLDETNFDGLICNDNIQVRRIVFYNYAPNGLFAGVPLYIFNCNNKSQGAILDSAQCQTYENASYYDFYTQASNVLWRTKQNPMHSWAVGFVTGYTYNPYWGPYGIDFDSMTFQNTQVYNASDKVITLALNHSEYRETYDFISGNLNLSNRTTPWTTAGDSCNYGDWQHDWINHRLFVCVNGNQMQTGFDNLTNKTGSYNVTFAPFEMIAVPCRVNCPSNFENQARESYIRNWSNASDWIEDNSTNSTNGTRRLSTTIDPNASSVTIPASWRMRVDVPRIPQTPNTSFQTLEIDGDLVFDEVAAAKNGYIEVYAEVIWVRGNFLVGSNIYNETTYTPLSVIQPYNGSLRIYLTGHANAPGLTLSEASSPGNKVFATTGMTYIVGQPRTLYMTKLAAPAIAGDTSISVIGDASSWAAGSLLGVSPTGQNISEFEFISVASVSYNATTNQTTINIDTSGARYASFNRSTGLPLQYDHYGCTVPEQITGVGAGVLDLRADVAILNREIVISANEINGTAAVDGWGASIYTTEVAFADLTTNTFVSERGTLKLDNIHCDFCGQADTYQAALHIENFTPDPANPAGYFVNSTITGCNGVGVTIAQASDFVINNNVIFQTVHYGVIFNGDSTNIVFSNNLIVGTGYRNTTTGAEHFSDLHACVYSEYQLLGNSSFINNTLAGCAFHGLIALGGDCQSPWVYQNNVVRISDYPFFIVAPNANCTYATGMVAYGGAESGITFVYNSVNVYVDNFIAVDSSIAFALNQGLSDDENPPSPVGFISVQNGFIGGPYYPYSTCAAAVLSTGLNYAGCSNRIGFLLPVPVEEGKVLPPTPSLLPWYDIESTGGWGSLAYWNNIQVSWFEDNTEFKCSNNYVFQSNPEASDNSAVSILSNFKTTHVDQQHIASFTPELAFWIGISKCGDWPCTGIKNILVKDLDGSLTGAPSSIIPLNQGITDSSCRLQGSLSYTCSSTNWAVLTFQSLDVDKDTRIFSPINITTPGGYTNDLNTMLDHCWDGFYSCLERTSRFPALVQTGYNYLINAAGTLPTQFQFHLFGTTNPTDWVLFNTHYTQGTAVFVMDANGNDIQPKILGPNENPSFDGDTCGVYTWQPSTAFITVKLTGQTNCTPTLYLSNTVYASVTYPMSVDDFYNVNGPTQFIDNIAAVLGIPLYMIRVVSIDNPSTSRRRLLKDARILQDSTKTVVEAYIVLPAANQGANSTTAQAVAQNYISLLNAGMNSGALAIGGINPDSATFQILLLGSNTTTTTVASSSTTIIVIAVVIPVFIVTLAVVGFICHKRAKARRSKIPKGEPKAFETVKMKIEPKREQDITDEDHIHDNSKLGLNQSNSVATDSNNHTTNRIIVDNKVLGDRILMDNGLALSESPNKISILPSAKHEQIL